MTLEDRLLLPGTMPLSQSRRLVLTIALVSRFLILVGMMASCRLIPDHNPGDDVQQFDMRLSSGCFCREGKACPCHSDDSSLQDCSVEKNQTVARSIVTEFYKVMLPPLTRWDAARFLSLAADPNRLRPDLTCDESDGTETCSVLSFVESEQAHAFFQLVPMLIRAVSSLLVWLPQSLQPPTYESVLVLAAWLLNTIAFILAALSLHELTYCITRRHAKRDESREQQCIQCAYTTALLFCFNPASVFFSSAYSESTFAMLTFTGYALAEHGQWFLAIACWMASSYARSNGTMTCLWIVLQTIGRCSLQSQSIPQKSCSVLFAAASIGCIVLPVLHHDWSGYNLHCNTVHASPDWCQRAADAKSFSLYGYVQRKHWNVGFLRYYEWKQVPNFLLAFPILFLGLSAVVTWIHHSCKTFINQKKESSHKTMWSRSLRLVHWALFAFRASQEGPIRVESSENIPYDALLVGPTMLSYYAGLAAACVVGATIAHVQISTRFICSSSPAIYWYMATISISDSKPGLTRALLNRKAIVYYCLGYIVLGIVMHVNWLPWT
jgi:phosphatidylinositol glycan class V